MLGRGSTSNRIFAQLGSPRACTGRSNIPSAPLLSAANCQRRICTGSRRGTRIQTAPTAGERKACSTDQHSSASFAARTTTNRSGANWPLAAATSGCNSQRRSNRTQTLCGGVAFNAARMASQPAPAPSLAINHSTSEPGGAPPFGKSRSKASHPKLAHRDRVSAATEQPVSCCWSWKILSRGNMVKCRNEVNGK